MNALLLNEMDELPDFSQPERFRVDTLDQVNWALRKMAAINAKKAENKNLADEEVSRICAWEEAESRKLDNGLLFFEGLLTEYALRKRDADPDFKKTSTPYGAVKFKKQPAKWNYDDAALLESLKSTGRTDLIRVKEEPNKVELKKIAKVHEGKVIDPETATIFEGVKVEEQPDSIIVEVGS